MNVIRVASVPAAHPYVSAIVDPTLIALLPDPIPLDATVPGQWWPPRWLDPDYLLSHIDDIDVLHVHFGFEGVEHDDLVAVADVLAAHRVPLVVTVHDLVNPHMDDQSHYVAKLGTLVRRADALTTLTAGAARRVADRWDAVPAVLPHPHLLPIDRVGVRRTPASRPRVAVHGKFLRANIDPWPVVDALVDSHLVPESISLRVDLDANALTSPRADERLPGRLADYRSCGVDVRIHPPFTDRELVDYLHEIDILVLPYRFGTHSGWIEACFDSGVLPVVPDCGLFHEQLACNTFGYGTDRFDEAGLLCAVDRAAAAVRALPGGDDLDRRRMRATQRREVRRATAQLYRRLLDTARIA